MQYLITPNPQSEEVEIMIQEIGPESYLYLCQLIQRFVEVGSFELSIETLKKTCRINARKAERIFPTLLKTFLKVVESLEKVSQIFGKHLANIDESFAKLWAKNAETLAKFDQSLGKLEASNPHGSTRVKSKQAKQASNTPPTPQGGESGLEFFDSHFWEIYPNPPGVGRRIDRKTCRALWKAKDLDKKATLVLSALKAQKASYEWTKEGGTFVPQAPRYLRRDMWNIGTQEVRPVANISEQRTKSLSAFPAIRHMGTGEVFLKADLVYTLNEIIYNGNVLDLAVYEGFTPNANVNPA